MALNITLGRLRDGRGFKATFDRGVRRARGRECAWAASLEAPTGHYIQVSLDE